MVFKKNKQRCCKKTFNIPEYTR